MWGLLCGMKTIIKWPIVLWPVIIGAYYYKPIIHKLVASDTKHTDKHFIYLYTNIYKLNNKMYINSLFCSPSI